MIDPLLSLFLIQGRTHCLLFLLLYVLGSVANPFQQLLTVPSVNCYLRPPFFKNNRVFYIKFDFFFEKRLFLIYFKNSFKIFLKYFFSYNSSVYFENIVVCNEPLSIWEFIKVGLSPSRKISFYLLQKKPFKNDEKCFLFYLKSSFHSQDI